MTRKDYELIAKAMEQELQGDIDPYVWMSVVNRLAFAFGKDNPRFNRHTFRDACGWVECTGKESENWS
jgi:hypothetical protein